MFSEVDAVQLELSPLHHFYLYVHQICNIHRQHLCKVHIKFIKATSTDVLLLYMHMHNLVVYTQIYFTLNLLFAWFLYDCIVLTSVSSSFDDGRDTPLG